MKMISKAGAAFLLVAVGASSAYAIPSFARQTGLSCDACHAGGMFPALTQVGRQFKLNGYTMGGGHTKMPLPLAAMIQVGLSSTSTGANGAQSANGVNENNKVGFPQMSIFYGGKIYGHVGALIQVTYDSSDLPQGLTTQRIRADNSDIRYANHTNFMGDNLIYGVSLNNSPTVQDVYASTPTWGFPWAAPNDTGNGAIAGPMIAGLGQQVVGLSAYALYNDFVYVEFGGYQDTQYRNGILKNMGFNDAGGITGYVSGTAPYARIAFQKYIGSNFFMIGGYGMDTNIAQSGTTKLDKYTDVAIDGEYQYIEGKNALTVAARNTWENQTLNGSKASSTTGTLSVFSSMATYVYDSTYGASIGYGNVTSTGVAAGQDSSSYTAQLNYFPMQNIRLVAQYQGYLKTASKTDAADTTDYNTLSLGAWFMF